MPRRKKSRAGRPSLGDRGRTKVVSVKFSLVEYDAISEAVAKENAEAVADPDCPPEEKPPVTISAWIRDHALDPLGLATFEAE